jgi:parvulin-like peptidyl-prolyl isomerase
MLANEYTDITPFQLRKYFGRGFTESVMELEPNVWTGPVLSGYGTHLVYVHKKIIPDALLLEEVKETVLSDYRDVKQKEIVKKYMESVVAKYEVIIQEETKVNK